MLPLVRNIVIVFLLLTIVYAILSFTARMRHRSQLAAEYKTQSEIKQITEDKETYIARGMKRYGRSYKPKLILGVYVIPMIIIGVLLYLAQYS